MDVIPDTMEDAELLDEVTEGWTVRRWASVNPGRVQDVTRLLTCWLWVRITRFRSYGAENVPGRGAVLMCPNHSTWYDGILYVIPIRRRMHWMGKSEVVSMPIIGSYLRRGGIFPVHRGRGDRLAMVIARQLLARGAAITIYPEGTRYKGPSGLGRAKSGAARLALETGTTVVPVGAYGIKASDYPDRASGRWWRRRVTAIYGAPLRFERAEPTAEAVAAARERIWREVARLYDLARKIHEMPVRPASIDEVWLASEGVDPPFAGGCARPALPRAGRGPASTP